MAPHSIEPKRLMAQRLREVLFVSSPYDLYVMEEEGLLADRISDEYTLLHLTSAPSITHASTAEEALEAVAERDFDLVVTGIRVGKGKSAYEMAEEIKKLKPGLPVVLLAPEIGLTSRSKKQIWGRR